MLYLPVLADHDTEVALLVRVTHGKSLDFWSIARMSLDVCASSCGFAMSCLLELVPSATAAFRRVEKERSEIETSLTRTLRRLYEWRGRPVGQRAKPGEA